MRRLLAIVLIGLVACGVGVEVATAKGVGTMPAPGGVIVPGVDSRYIAISPHNGERLTVVARVDRDDGELGRWWHLRGAWFVPAVAYDFSPGGLSADGRTLVLSGFSRTYPPRVSRFAILNTQRAFRWNGPGRPPRNRRFFDYVDLSGDFSFDALSPDGSTLYLIQRYLPPSSGGDYITNYKVRAYDLETDRLLPQPIVDPKEPDERMGGLPVTRVTSADGRWAYTLYDGDEKKPFVHALDTVGRRAVCIDLPQLGGREFDGRRLNAFMLRLRLDRDDKRLTVMSGPPPPEELPPLSQGRPLRSSSPRPLLVVDTRSFEVGRPATRSGVGNGELPWLPFGLVFVALLLGIAWVAGRQRLGIGGKRSEQA